MKKDFYSVRMDIPMKYWTNEIIKIKEKELKTLSITEDIDYSLKQNNLINNGFLFLLKYLFPYQVL